MSNFICSVSDLNKCFEVINRIDIIKPISISVFNNGIKFTYEYNGHNEHYQLVPTTNGLLDLQIVDKGKVHLIVTGSIEWVVVNFKKYIPEYGTEVDISNNIIIEDENGEFIMFET